MTLVRLGLWAAPLLLASTPAAADANAADLSAYLRARVADADGAVGVAVAAYAKALADAAADSAVARRAYREAVRAGDMPLADRAAAALAKQGDTPADAALLAIAAAARAHDRAAADAALKTLEAAPLRLLAPPLRAWTAQEFGGDPFAAFTPPPADPVARRFAAEARALILLARGDTDAGLAALRAFLGNDQASDDLRIAAARLLIARGDVANARALLTSDTPAVQALRADPRAAIASGLALGATTLFTRVASDLALGPPGPVGYTLIQAALRADPRNDRARLLLAAALTRDKATDRALAALDTIDRAGPYASDATTLRIQVLAAAGRTDAALAVARVDAQGAATDDQRQRLADLYMRLDRPADAAPLYGTLAQRSSATWSDWLQYGAALDRAGNWREALPALRRAAAFAPDEPLVLNYLGYSLAEHRESMGEAQQLLERAVRVKPDDPAIADSLGWVLFLRGDTARALPLVEQAAAADPTNPEIGEHLGDIYWRTGRRYEARYAWTAAQSAATVPADAARLGRKIADGI